jgi:hypothetical protein
LGDVEISAFPDQGHGWWQPGFIYRHIVIVKAARHGYIAEEIGLDADNVSH